MNYSSAEAALLISRLAESDLFVRYGDAFLQASGCQLSLSKEEAPLSDLPFAVNVRIPVEVSGRTLAYLSLETIRLTDGLYLTFEAVAREMLDEGCSAAELRKAQTIFQQAPTMTQSYREALQTLLQLFASQLGEHAEKLFLQTMDTEPDAVRRARHHILSHLTEPLALDDVAKQAGVSPFHFCKIFKRTTGLTFTDFVNRARVEQAKRLLLKPCARITEVAYDVGFQSLSQFNRSFRRIMDQSPTEFRSSMVLA